MSLSKDTVVASCPTCDSQGTHRRTHERAKVIHFRCQACRSVTAYRRRPKTESGPELERLSFEMLTEKQPADKAPAYSALDPYSSGAWFAHPRFGIGYVLEILSPPKKMEVLFPDKRRVLVCGAGSSEDDLVADAAAKSSPKPSPKKTRRPRRKNKQDTTSGTDASPSNDLVTPTSRVICPTCGSGVHPYNVLHTPGSQPNRCMHCKR